MKALRIVLLFVVLFSGFNSVKAQPAASAQKTVPYTFKDVLGYEWAPDSSRVAVQQWGEQITILNPNLETSESLEGFAVVWSPNSKLISFVKRSKTRQDVDANVFVYDFTKAAFAVTNKRYGYYYYGGQIFSPDSKWLLLSGNNGNLMKIKLDPVTPYWVSRGKVDSPVAWDENGITFFSQSRDPFGFWHMDIDGKNVHPLPDYQQNIVRKSTISFSPNGKWRTELNDTNGTLTITHS